MRRILGIDPGSRLTGYGIIESDGIKSRHIASGCIRFAGDEFPLRLGVIYRELSELVENYHPD